ncbi:hypothetical protein LJC49_10865 [Ruminococcaceae bacterium OttesenSCG-928-I18]|nr:hypothetical protein [Ruminococcaceae bacterium OttesenSCG-928-I18]
MSGLWALIRVHFQSLLLTTAGGRGRGGKRRQMSGLKAFVFLAFVMAFISGSYSMMLAQALGPLGGLDIMLMMMVVMGVLFCIFFTVYLAQGLLFSTKDIDLVLSLPVSSFSVLLAKVAALYLEILFMLELFLLPAGVVWLTSGGSGGLGFLLLLLLEGVFLSFVPAFVALLFGTLISMLISRMRYKNLFNTVFSLLLVGVIIVASVGIPRYIETSGTDIDGMRSTLASFFPPLSWMVRAVIEPNGLLLLAVAALCLVPFFLLVLLASRFYKKLLTSLLGRQVRSDYKLGTVGSRGGFSALLAKEARRFFTTPAYLLNAGMGMMMLLVATVVFLFTKNSIHAALASIAALAGGLSLASVLPLLVLVVMVLCIMSFLPSSVSISLEGKTLWILKEAPLDVGRIFLAKAGFHFLCGAAVCVLVTPIEAYVFSLSPFSALGVLLLSLLYLALTAMTGLAINLKFPRLDAENDTVVIKQSASVIFSMLAGLLEAALLVCVYLVCSALGLGFTVFSLVGGLILLLLCCLLARWLSTRGRTLFAAL